MADRHTVVENKNKGAWNKENMNNGIDKKTEEKRTKHYKRRRNSRKDRKSVFFCCRKQMI